MQRTSQLIAWVTEQWDNLSWETAFDWGVQGGLLLLTALAGWCAWKVLGWGKSRILAFLRPQRHPAVSAVLAHLADSESIWDAKGSLLMAGNVSVKVTDCVHGYITGIQWLRTGQGESEDVLADLSAREKAVILKAVRQAIARTIVREREERLATVQRRLEPKLAGKQEPGIVWDQVPIKTRATG